MTLYERIVSPKGKVSYREYRPDSAALDKLEVDNREIITLLTVFVLSWMKTIIEQLPPHSALSRQLQNVEAGIVKAAGLACKLTSEVIDVGVEGWNAASKAVMDGMLRVKSHG